MTIIDVLIVLCPIYLFVLLVRQRKEVQRLGLTSGTALVLVGVAVMALLYLGDFLAMHFAPLLVAREDAMQFMRHLHQTFSWISALMGVGCISLGLGYLLRILIPKASAGAARLENLVIERTADLSKSHLRLQVILSEQRKIQQALKRSEERFRELVDLLPQTVFEVSSSGDIVFANRAGLEAFQFTPAEIGSGLNIRSYFIDSDRERVLSNFRRILAGEKLGANEYTMQRKDKTTLSVIISTRPIVREGILMGAIGVIFDITERKKTERELEASRTMLRLVLDTIPVRVFWKDLDSNFLGCNLQFAKDSGLEAPQNVIGKNDFQISRSGEAERFRADDRQVMQSGIPKLNYEESRMGPDSRECWLRTSKIPLLDPDRKVFGILGCYEDITKARQLSQQLEYMASHDALTGLVNRREFEQRLFRVLETTQSDSSRHALCYLDIDQFKIVNDICGHTAGDELLSQLGTVLQQHVRYRDTLARLGGDEFGVLMEHCSIEQVTRVANILRQAVAEFRFTWDGRSFKIGASIGVVPISKVTGNISELLIKADAACYAAKDKGRNRIHIYREDDWELVQREGEMQWVSILHEALEENRFQLYAQPIIPLTGVTAEGKHFEILTRMVGKNGQLILPGAFLPAAERYNLSPRLDRWVLEKSFEWLAAESSNRMERINLCSINLSGHSLSDEEFQTFVVEQLAKYTIPPGKVCFEITETAAISNLSRAIRFITRLKERGCRFALDDFGSGLSSFAYLKNLPVDFLKIDGMFIIDIIDDPIDLAMVRSINEIGQLMGKRTIAEFVENDEVKNKLEEIGINYVQGYGASPPVPLDEIM